MRQNVADMDESEMVLGTCLYVVKQRKSNFCLSWKSKYSLRYVKVNSV